MYDYLIVGSGLFGAVFAEKAKAAGKKVLVLEKRDHIGGNCFTEKVEGINVHKYGPHIFHTNSKKIWDYVNGLAEFNRFVNRPKVRHKNTFYSFPINLMTLNQLWGFMTPEMAEQKLKEVRVPIENPRNLEEWALSQVGEEIYQIFIYGYTKKQWRRDPKDLPASIIKRLPIRLTFDDDHFTDRYEGIPIGGYTQMFEKMLDGVEVRLGETFDLHADWRSYAKKLVYTGKIDHLFDYKFGDLEYLSLEFEQEIHTGDFQGNAIINHAEEAIPWTRSVEHKHFEGLKTEKTVVTWELPVEYTRDTTPFYPVNDQKNNGLHARYVEELKKHPDITGGGRLFDYRYYDMHQVIGSAMAFSDRELR